VTPRLDWPGRPVEPRVPRLTLTPKPLVARPRTVPSQHRLPEVPGRWWAPPPETTPGVRPQRVDLCTPDFVQLHDGLTPTCKVEQIQPNIRRLGQKSPAPPGNQATVALWELTQSTAASQLLPVCSLMCRSTVVPRLHASVRCPYARERDSPLPPEPWRPRTTSPRPPLYPTRSGPDQRRSGPPWRRRGGLDRRARAPLTIDADQLAQLTEQGGHLRGRQRLDRLAEAVGQRDRQPLGVRALARWMRSAALILPAPRSRGMLPRWRPGAPARRTRRGLASLHQACGVSGGA
jgi:hypothetical protein